LLTVGFLAGSLYSPRLLLALISFVCYLTAPVSYELTDNRLTVFTHLGSRDFGPVLRCAPVEGSIWWGVRVFGNGGMFAGTGYYWTPRYGFFQAYVTTARRSEMVMVDTPTRRVLISPENADEFIASCAAASSA
jgi:hypothetical protein